MNLIQSNQLAAGRGTPPSAYQVVNQPKQVLPTESLTSRSTVRQSTLHHRARCNTDTAQRKLVARRPVGTIIKAQRRTNQSIATYDDPTRRLRTRYY